jgi:SagB-type dehydrogenase family enzyme
MWKYGQRGYRYVWLDAGHLAQNLCLTATAENLGAVTVGAFFDAELNILLDLPAGEEDAVYIVCIGQPAEV